MNTLPFWCFYFHAAFLFLRIFSVSNMHGWITPALFGILHRRDRAAAAGGWRSGQVFISIFMDLHSLNEEKRCSYSHSKAMRGLFMTLEMYKFEKHRWVFKGLITAGVEIWCSIKVYLLPKSHSLAIQRTQLVFVRFKATYQKQLRLRFPYNES